MQFLSTMLHLPSTHPRPSLDTQLLGPRIFLRVGVAEDWKSWRLMRNLSKDHLVPWEPMWPADALSYTYYSSLLRRQWREWRSGKAFAFTIFLHGGQHPILIGGITLSDIIYAAAQKATIGYWMSKSYARQGLMTEAVGLVSSFAFDVLHLQRLEASCMPHNEASKIVLKRTGFEEEGYAKAYLQINGCREDHLLWGKARYPSPQAKITNPP